MNDLARTDYSFRKPNRRYMPEHILPTQYSYGLEHIAIIVDVSGSINKDQFTQFMSDTYHILNNYRPTKLTILQFGSNICSVDEVTDVGQLLNVEMVNGGGTAIVPVIDWMKENKPKGAIVFTDGWFNEDYYEDPKVPTVWAIHTNKKFKKRFGTHIEYEL
jgi:predicted metal-dependent peptidase